MLARLTGNPVLRHRPSHARACHRMRPRAPPLHHPSRRPREGAWRVHLPPPRIHETRSARVRSHADHATPNKYLFPFTGSRPQAVCGEHGPARRGKRGAGGFHIINQDQRCARLRGVPGTPATAPATAPANTPAAASEQPAEPPPGLPRGHERAAGVAYPFSPWHLSLRRPVASADRSNDRSTNDRSDGPGEHHRVIDPRAHTAGERCGDRDDEQAVLVGAGPVEFPIQDEAQFSTQARPKTPGPVKLDLQQGPAEFPAVFTEPYESVPGHARIPARRAPRRVRFERGHFKGSGGPATSPAILRGVVGSPRRLGGADVPGWRDHAKPCPLDLCQGVREIGTTVDRIARGNRRRRR